MTSKCKSWRDILPIHPAAELFPRMSESELHELGEDIKKNGLLNPIVLYGELVKRTAVSNGFKYSLLDGTNRLDAMEAVGLRFKVGCRRKEPTLEIEGEFDRAVPEPVITYKTEGDPFEFVLSANLHRRHLSADQKRDVIAKLLKATPEKSDRQIAEQIKTSPSTVGRVRKELETTGDVSKLDTRTDARGRKQQAHKKPTKDPAVIAAADRAEARSNTKPAASDAIESMRARPVGATRHTPEEERWHNSLGSCAGESIALEALWRQEFGEQWKAFAVEPEHRTLARQAAEAWTTIAEQLEKRGKPVDNLDIPEFLRRQAT